MKNSTDLLGALLQSGMKESSSSRLAHSLGEQGIGKSGGILEELLGSLTGGGASSSVPAADAGGLGALKDLAGSILGDSQNLKTGGLGALAGALLGGGGKSLKGAMGGGALALLGTLALQALRSAGQKSDAEATQVDASSRLAAGLRAPENADEQQKVQSIAELIVKAMVNAAKADGRVDEAELKRIVGKVGENGIQPGEQEELIAELRKPMDTASIVRAVPNQQVAAQVYAASLMAVQLDTPAEKRYLADLADQLGLRDNVIAYLHRAVGVA